MTLADLAATLEANGVRLGARLVVDAPAGVLTDELRAALTAHRSLLLQRVAREAAWNELSTWRWGGADEAPGIDRIPPADLADDRADAGADDDRADAGWWIGSTARADR